MDTNTMYSLYKKGCSLADVASVYGISRQSVYERFKRKNLKMRPLKRKPFIIVDNLKYTINRDGYYECTTKDRLMLHNYIWEKFNGKIPKGYEVHHIDLNKINNNIDNLMLLTPSEHTKLHSDLKNGSGMNKKVRCIETGEVFNSISELARLLGHHQSNISRYYIKEGRRLNGKTYEKI